MAAAGQWAGTHHDDGGDDERRGGGGLRSGGADGSDRREVSGHI